MFLKLNWIVPKGINSLLLDIASGKRKSKSAANSKSGVIGLLAWCAQQTVAATGLHAIMEGTGSYHGQAALALFDAGVTVSIANPAFMPLGCKLKALAAAWVSAPKPTILAA